MDWKRLKNCYELYVLFDPNIFFDTQQIVYLKRDLKTTNNKLQKNSRVFHRQLELTGRGRRHAILR